MNIPSIQEELAKRMLATEARNLMAHFTIESIEEICTYFHHIHDQIGEKLTGNLKIIIFFDEKHFNGLAPHVGHTIIKEMENHGLLTEGSRVCELHAVPSPKLDNHFEISISRYIDADTGGKTPEKVVRRSSRKTKR